MRSLIVSKSRALKCDRRFMEDIGTSSCVVQVLRFFAPFSFLLAQSSSATILRLDVYMSALVPSSLKRGSRVVLSVVARASNNEYDSLQGDEVGVIVQIMRDQLLWRQRREVGYVAHVRGPRGETTIFKPEQIMPAPPLKITPAMPTLTSTAVRPNNGSSTSPARPGDLNQSMGTTLPVIVRKHSYDAVESASSDDCDDVDFVESVHLASNDKHDEWEEVFVPPASIEEEGPPVLPRTCSSIDAEIRIAYWRDPVKVQKEMAKCKRLGVVPPQTAVQARLAECAFQVDTISTKDILGGKLTVKQYQVLVVPGGYAPNYLEALGDDSDDDRGVIVGGKFIQDYVSSGGGFVGICAGAYAGSNWGWGLIDVDIVDIEHWCRGMSQRCFLSYTDAGRDIMNAQNVEESVVRYANGPIMAIGEHAPDDTFAVALFRSDFARKASSPIGVMKDSAAIIASNPPLQSGRGRVVLLSPHMEDGEPWTRAHFRNLFRWTARQNPGEDHSPKTFPGFRSCEAADHQRLIRGAWWRTLPRQDAQRYPPRMKDHGVPTGLSQLNEEGKQSKSINKNVVSPAPPPRSSFLKTPLGGRAAVGVSRNNHGMSKKDQSTRKPLVCWKDGYSMLIGSSKLALPFVECIAGPILITAPHGLKLAGPRRGHLREKYTSELALLLAKALAKYTIGASKYQIASFCVWNYKTARKRDKSNLDPNYLYRSEWPRSPFHTALLKFRAKYRDRGIPCLHVDFHGKNDRKKSTKHRVDIGMEPFIQHQSKVSGWSFEDVESLREVAKHELDNALQGKIIRRKSCDANADPRLHGWWGDDDDSDNESHECEMTMTHQAVLEGIPSLQLEVPRSLRKEMMIDVELLDKIAAAIAGVYRQTMEIERENNLLPKTFVSDVVLVEELEAAVKAGDGSFCRSFFVYGSLRPDDPSEMPWRDNWLRGAERKPMVGFIRGIMYDDDYASLVIPGEGSTGRDTVKGYLIQFPEELHERKLSDADEIEGVADGLYDRVLTVVDIEGGSPQIAWVYVRPGCSRKKRVPNGDWVSYQEAACRRKCCPVPKGREPNGLGPELQVLDFIQAGFPEYRGQIDTSNEEGKAAFSSEKGGFDMIDAMVRDCVMLDKYDMDRQI